MFKFISRSSVTKSRKFSLSVLIIFILSIGLYYYYFSDSAKLKRMTVQRTHGVYELSLNWGSKKIKGEVKDLKITRYRTDEDVEFSICHALVKYIDSRDRVLWREYRYVWLKNNKSLRSKAGTRIQHRIYEHKDQEWIPAHIMDIGSIDFTQLDSPEDFPCIIVQSDLKRFRIKKL